MVRNNDGPPDVDAGGGKIKVCPFEGQEFGAADTGGPFQQQSGIHFRIGHCFVKQALPFKSGQWRKFLTALLGQGHAFAGQPVQNFFIEGFVKGNAQDGKGQFCQARPAAVIRDFVYHSLNVNAFEFLQLNVTKTGHDMVGYY